MAGFWRREERGDGGLTVIGMRMLRLETATEATTVAATMIRGRSPGALAGAASLGSNQDVHLSKPRRCTILLQIPQLELESISGCFAKQ